jgi:outer membrane protein assembly factor BamB
MPSRRTVLRLGATTGLAALAGCANDAAESTTTSQGSERTATETGTPPPTTAGTTTGPGGSDRVDWATSLGSPVPNAPTLADDTLYAGTEGGTVAAIALADGSEQWTFEAEQPIRERPAVSDDLVLAVGGGPQLGSDQTVFAIDRASGTERWSFAPQEWWLDVLGADGDTAFVATTDDAISASGQTLYGLSLADGREQWSVEVGDNSGGLVTDATVFVPSVDTLRAVSTDGDVRWTYEGREYQFNTLSAAGGTIAFTTGSDPTEWSVRGHDARSGEVRWTYGEHDAYTTRAAGDRLFVGGSEVARLDPASGAEQWAVDVTAALYDAPVVDDTLYVAGDAAAAIATGDGTVSWTRGLDTYLAMPAGVSGDAFVLLTSPSREQRNREVTVLDATSGEPRFTYAADAELTTPVVARDWAVVTREGEVVALAL